MLSLREAWDAENLSFQPTELHHWDSGGWAWLLPLPLGNGKLTLRVKIKNVEQNSHTVSQFPLDLGPTVHEALLVFFWFFWSLHIY